MKLAALDGDTYGFAAGDRDRHLDFEPTFAPVASGGKFWVVFHSRRTYGNELTGVAYNGEGNGVKQLWVAAIDQNPTAGVDPSHPAFHSARAVAPHAQHARLLGTRAVQRQWHAGCGSGTECCGGYCAGGGAGTDASALVCSATAVGCSQEGDKCATASDCCAVGGAAQVCINSVCSFGGGVK